MFKVVRTLSGIERTISTWLRARCLKNIYQFLIQESLCNCLDFKTLSNIYVMFGFRKVLWKKKNVDENDFLMFDCIMELIKKYNIIKINVKMIYF